MARRFHSSDLTRAEWGCERCTKGGHSKNAQALAAKHHDKTGHPSWAELTTRVQYGTISGSKKDTGNQRSFFP